MVKVSPDNDCLVRKVSVLYYNIPSLKATVKEIYVRQLTVLLAAGIVTAATKKF